MDKLYIIMPAYNEQDNIEETVRQWHNVLEASKDISNKSKLVIIDDGSKDNTYKTLLDLQKKYNCLLPLTKKNQGHGPTLIYGYKYAIDNGADYIFQTDSDGQTNPDEFLEFWNNRKQYEAIIGNRTERGDGKSRAFVERIVCFLLKCYFGVKVPDANAPFRLMKTSLVNKYINKLPEDYNLPNIMLTTYFTYYKENVCFKEISFKPRQAGTNSINIKKIVKIGFISLKDFRSFKKVMKNENKQ